jgi:hypothetical protein
VEWLEGFMEAREKSVTKQNILLGWRGAGLFPKNIDQILIQLANHKEPAPLNIPMPASITPVPFFSNSSPFNLGSLYIIN